MRRMSRSTALRVEAREVGHLAVLNDAEVQTEEDEDLEEAQGEPEVDGGLEGEERESEEGELEEEELAVLETVEEGEEIAEGGDGALGGARVAVAGRGRGRTVDHVGLGGVRAGGARCARLLLFLLGGHHLALDALLLRPLLRRLLLGVDAEDGAQAVKRALRGLLLRVVARGGARRDAPRARADRDARDAATDRADCARLRRDARGAVAPAPAPAARARVATSESACVEAMVAMSNVRPASDATPRAGEVRALAVNRRVSASAQRGSHVAISPSTPSRVQSNPRFRVRDPRLANRAESHTSGHRWREELRRSLTGTARQL